MPKVFDFPVPAESLTVALKVNCQQVDKVEMAEEVSDPPIVLPWRVTVGRFVARFGTQAEAQAFFELWAGRVENAK